MTKRTVILTGGVGGAKLVLGLAQVVPPADITAIVNTGDDFVHLGLSISPDLDTLLYTLAGKASHEHGWGREGETWQFMEALRPLGGEDWFSLGDGDLALHVLRTAARGRGEALSAITAGFARAWGVETAMLPMSNEPVATWLDTDAGSLPFQRYFVEHRCEPTAHAIRFEGAAAARPGPGVVEAITDPDARAILIAPSNPYLSIDPILAVPGIRDALAAATAPVIAVSPIIEGQAVKGPTVKLMRELGIAPGSDAIASHYGAILDGMVLDTKDASAPPPIPHLTTDTMMHDLDDRARVAAAALELADRLAGGGAA